MPMSDSSTSSRRVALVVHPLRPVAAALAARARRWWEAHGYEVLEDDGREGPAGPRELPGPLDFAVSLGGDGTMLRTVQLVVGQGVPVLGVNVGHLGYLTQVEPDELEIAFERLVSGDFEVEERMTLEVAIERPPGPRRLVFVALNEAAVEKTTPGHTIRLPVSIAGRPFLTYAADGILVATPTGSTAYNLSLRGPIVSPRVRALLLTPISPHMLFDRSLVLEPEESVRLALMDGRPGVLVVDGSVTTTLEPGESVVLSAGAQSARVIRFGLHDFHAILRAKFNLVDR